MISRIDFIHKDNITAGTVAASYTNVYDFEYPEQKFNEDFQWFATSPRDVSFSLIFDSWIEDNIFDETHPTLKNIDGTPLSNDSGNKFNRHVVRVYEDDVLFFEGIITVEDLDYSVNDQMIKIIVRDYLVLFTDIEKIEYDLTNSSTTAVSRTLLNEPFLLKYAHDIYNLLRIIKTTAEQQYFNPDYVKFNIEKDDAIVNKHGGTILFRNTWLWNDKVFSLSQFKNNYDNGWFQAEIRTFNAHTGIEQFGGIFNLPYSDYYGASAVEEAINNILFQSGMTGQTWQANYSYAQDTSVFPFPTRLYRLEKVEQPTGGYDEYRVYRNVINLDTNPNDDNEPNGHAESTSYPVLINPVLDFNVKQQAPYEDFVSGLVDGIQVDYEKYADNIFASTHTVSGAKTTIAIFRAKYEAVGTDLYVYYFRLSNTWRITDGVNLGTAFTLRQEVHVFRNFVEVIPLQVVYNYSTNIPIELRDIYTWITEYHAYIGLNREKFDAADVYIEDTFNRDGSWSNTDSSFPGQSSAKNTVSTNSNTYTLTVGKYELDYGAYSAKAAISISFKGYSATPYLNYAEPVTTTDILKIITILNNCSYYCKLNTFYVSDKDYVLDASSESISSENMIDVNKSRVWSAVIDESIYDKLLVFDIKVFKKFVEDYYNLIFFAKVKQKISFTLSTIFESTVINLGSRLSYLGKDYIVSSWKKIYENIFEISAFNDTLTVLQLSDDGVTFSDAELSDDGINFEKWNVKDV